MKQNSSLVKLHGGGSESAGALAVATKEAGQLARRKEKAGAAVENGGLWRWLNRRFISYSIVSFEYLGLNRYLQEDRFILTWIRVGLINN